ncbi:MAG TPA: lipopolysaccharide biosynthesis protein RfbH [Caulobacter sp.]|nr:lipopolysaccharide biosynthesis protein RfbH [Caulobacter sp.]
MSFQEPSEETAALRGRILALVEEYHALAHAPKAFEAGASPVPVSGRIYDASDMRSLVDSALDFWLTTGRFNDAFEARLAQRLGARFAMTVNSGSSANLVALSALTSPKLKARQLKPGDEVITAATGFPTTVNPLLGAGLIPVFVDMLPTTYNFDPDKVAAAITPKTRAIMAAHTLGNPFDLAAIRKLCDDHDLWLVEDCCDALGSTYDGRQVGTFGDIATLSFYPAHHITTGEGGAVFTNDEFLRRLAESFRDWGRDCFCAPGQDNTCGKRFGWKMGDLPRGYDHKYTYGHLGYNLKMTDMQASVGLAQMDHLDGFIAARRRNFAALQAGLTDLQDVLMLPEATPNSDPAWFGFPITVRAEAPFTRNALTRRLEDAHIGTRLLFGGNLVRQPYMAGRNFRIAGELTVADTIMERTFWIGVYPGLGADHVAYMLDVIHDFCRTA